MKKQNVSKKSQKHFCFSEAKKGFRNKCFLSAQTGKHLGKQQCFRNNVSSFCGGLKLFSPVLTTACELHSESPFQCKNYFSTAFDKTCTKQPVVRKDINLLVLVPTAVTVRCFCFNPLQTMFRNLFVGSIKYKPYFKGGQELKSAVCCFPEIIQERILQ